jgi:general secretion pathway protein G
MKKHKWMNQKGMTLIEIMVVVTILGIIATLVTINVIGRLDQAKVSAAKTQIKNLETALDEFRRDNGFYPSTEQGLRALVEKPSTGRAVQSYPRGGYLKGGQIPKDTWGCEFLYYSPGLHGNPYEITSLGADCQEGGEDVDADINSWEIGLTKEEE